MNKNNNNDKEKYDQELQELSIKAQLANIVLDKTVKFFIDTVKDEYHDARKGHLLVDDLAGNLYTIASAFHTRLLDRLSETGIFPGLDNEDVKIDLMEQAITAQMALVANLRDGKKYV